MLWSELRARVKFLCDGELSWLNRIYVNSGEILAKESDFVISVDATGLSIHFPQFAERFRSLCSNFNKKSIKIVEVGSDSSIETFQEILKSFHGFRLASFVLFSITPFQTILMPESATEEIAFKILYAAMLVFSPQAVSEGFREEYFCSSFNSSSKCATLSSKKVFETNYKSCATPRATTMKASCCCRHKEMFR